MKARSWLFPVFTLATGIVSIAVGAWALALEYQAHRQIERLWIEAKTQSEVAR